jgi:D-glycero-alpha-D-manno-heptose-7-phosphate kinase
MGDLPARTGLGSSSSFTVGLLHALHTYAGRAVGPQQLAVEACEIEHNWIKERVGYQDQYMAAFGGFQHIRFPASGEVIVTPIPLSAQRRAALRAHLIVFYTGVTRLAHQVLKEQIERTNSDENEAALKEMRAMVGEGVRLLASEADLCEFGALLHASWTLKQSLSSTIANPTITQAYAAARAAGAIGGKLLGAGGGGFLLFLAPPERHNAIRSALQPLRELPFAFEPAGSRILAYMAESVPCAAAQP